MRKLDTQTASHQINSTLLILLTLVLGLLAPSFVFAQSREKSPLDTQLLPVGELFSLIIRADGESNPPARITANSLPSNAVLLRNLDGSRTFMWIPQEEDIGEKTIEVTVTDAEDSAIAATYPIHFEVVNQLAGANAAADNVEPIDAANTDTAASEPTVSDVSIEPETAAEPEAEAAVKATTDATIEPDTDATIEPDTDATVEPDTDAAIEPDTGATVEPDTDATIEPDTDATVEPDTDAAIEPDTDATIEPDTDATIEPDTDATIEPDTDAAIEPDTDTAVVEPEAVTTVETDTDTSAEGDGVEQEQLPPPELDVPSQEITAQIYKVMRVSIAHRDLSGTPANLTALNMPKNARLEASAEGHVIEWTPEALDIGKTAIILIAQDKNSPELRTTRRLNISVSR